MEVRVGEGKREKGGEIEEAVKSERVHMDNGEQVGIRKEKGAERKKGIGSGVEEENAIDRKMTRITHERPINNDVMASTLGELEIGLSRIVVTSPSNDAFFARPHLRQTGRDPDLDARPSDATAPAVRSECPVVAADGVRANADSLPHNEPEGGGRHVRRRRRASLVPTVRHPRPAAGDRPGGVLPAVRDPAAAGGSDGGSVGVVQVLAAVPGAAVRGDGDRPGGVCILRDCLRRCL